MRLFVPNRNSCDPAVHARLSLMKKRVARRPCTHVLSSPPSVVNGALAPLPWRTMGNAASVLLQIGRAEQAFVPRERRVEVVHQMPGEHVRVARCERV